MFNDEGLGAAMGQYAAEKKADDLAKRLAIMEERLKRLEHALEFTGGDPNYLIEHRKKTRGAQ